jgi:hypothetical protein
MDISMNNINSLTLECFLNKSQYQHVLTKQELFNDKQFVSDKRFYKKRILDLTKKIFRDEVNDSHLISSFNSYIKACINYLYFIDKTDIIQDKYVEECEKPDEPFLEECEKPDEPFLEGYKNCDNLLTKETEVKKITLFDNYIKKNKPTIVLPIQNTYNLKTSEFKTKGISKKKNINNKYEDNETIQTKKKT